MAEVKLEEDAARRDPEVAREWPALSRTHLQQEQDSTHEWFDGFDRAFTAAVGAPELQALRQQMEPLRKLDGQIDEAGSPESLAGIRTSATKARITFLASLISKTDHDVDPGQKNAALQKALTTLVQITGLAFIEPRRGDEMDPPRHVSLGTSSASDRPEMRGRVAAVLARGLTGGNGRVYAKAEIREFD